MLINKLIEYRTYPSKLKLAKIILIYKSGDESDPAGPPIIDPYRFSPSLTVSLTKQLALLPALDTLYPWIHHMYISLIQPYLLYGIVAVG